MNTKKAASYRAESLKAIIESEKCSSHECWFGGPKGVGTNGGCRHDKMTLQELRANYRAIIQRARKLEKES